MSDEFPLVSIITPVYNGAQFIEELILSVKRQDYPNIEHIIIDDGSSDCVDIEAMINRYPEAGWLRRGVNKGQYFTMNEGLRAAKGEIVCFVNADDVVATNAVKTAVNFLQQKNLDGVFGITAYIDDVGNDCQLPRLFPFSPITFVGYLAHIPHCSFYIKSSALKRHNLFFDPTLKYVGDYEWLIRVAKSPLKIGGVKKQFSKFRIHPNQATQKYADISLIERRAVMTKYNINARLTSLAEWIYFVQYRVWELSNIYQEGGFVRTIKFVAERVKNKLS